MGAAGTFSTSYTFSASDNGVHTIANSAKLFAVGSGVYSVTSPFLPDASGTIDVVAGQAAKFTVTANQTTAATDAYGNAITNYVGTARISSTDAQRNLPSSYTFTNADAGVHAFSATLKTAGSQSITVTDTTNVTEK